FCPLSHTLPRSTLVPYTTLFRSQDLEISYRPVDLRSMIDEAYQQRRPASVRDVERRGSNGDTQFFDVEVVPLLDKGTPLGASISDRKSTRLNSSHQIISYAVFCL